MSNRLFSMWKTHSLMNKNIHLLRNAEGSNRHSLFPYKNDFFVHNVRCRPCFNSRPNMFQEGYCFEGCNGGSCVRREERCPFEHREPPYMIGIVHTRKEKYSYEISY